MHENETKLKEIFEVLNKEGFLSNLIIIGSWCLLFYKNIFDNFNPTIRTTDIDFYVPNTKTIKERYNIIRSLKNINYDHINDILTNKTIFISPDGFELEFLTKLNRSGLSCVRIGKTSIYAESMPYLDLFNFHYMEIDFFGMNIKVASPTSYVLQKLLVNKSRKGDKQEKDIESVKWVLVFIKASKKYYEELNTLFKGFPLKWQKQIIKTCNIYQIKLFE